MFDTLKKSNKNFKDLIVVHNLQNVTTSTELQVAWNKICACYMGTVQYDEIQIETTSGDGEVQIKKKIVPMFVTNQVNAGT